MQVYFLCASLVPEVHGAGDNDALEQLPEGLPRRADQQDADADAGQGPLPKVNMVNDITLQTIA